MSPTASHLKLDNVLLTSSGVIKIIDFGLSHTYDAAPDGTADRSVGLKDSVGTKPYAAPEVLSCARADYDGDGYDGFAADVWSIGVMLYAMLSGRQPPCRVAEPSDPHFSLMLDAEANGRSTTRAVMGPQDPSFDLVIDLLDGMLVINPTKRATIFALRNHPWLAVQPTLRGLGPAAAADQPVYRGLDEPPPAADLPEYRGLDPLPVLGGGLNSTPPPPMLSQQNAFASFLVDVES